MSLLDRLRRAVYPPGPYATFTAEPEPQPAGCMTVDYLDCDGPCRRRHTPHEVDGPLARCCTCRTERAATQPALEVRRA